MPLRITATVRNAIRQIVADSRYYDADTVKIGRNGIVTARKDPKKTSQAHRLIRDVVGHADDMVNQDGTIQEHSRTP